MTTKRIINPFRYDRLPDDSAFFDRETEVERIISSIVGQENLLVRGERRMGKTSCLLRAARKAAHEHGAICFFADLRRYSTLADVTQGLLKNAVPALSSLGERTASWLASTVKGLILKPHIKASTDASKAGGPDLDIEVGLELRANDAAAHSQAFNDVLDALNMLAGRKRRTVAVILDEFTFLDQMGLDNDKASWQLRSTIQRHQHVSYVLAGSTRHLIDRLHGRDGPFFGMFGRLSVGPIESTKFAVWIDAQFTENDIKAKGVGEACIRLAGPRTRDILQLARRAYDLAAASLHADEALVGAALESLIEDFDEEFLDIWGALSPLKKGILNAMAESAGVANFNASTIARHGLRSSAAVSQACHDLMRTRSLGIDNRPPILMRIAEHPVTYSFDNPFFGAWVSRLSVREVFPRAE